ncbi:putative leucine-rich repeat receptor-like serine/threonine-protein kinase At2g04300 [Salvia miltiorrhiza]|uniref:putative leucine-rich repeat receptor-like serine/threonine-protein kinase At2g04300 n=1 Tax=Salvia miltiorrhiza TaxID=226208 RepID=UPI0025ACE4D2|nr:putative leucine-rich repeat receptor-like serine/threonine-protein kinase At2g04300 [Salvia miltiorrhiza]
MASHILSLTIFFILFLISANGRLLQKGESVNPGSHFLSTANAKIKAVSRATADSYTTNYNDVLGLGVLVTQFPSLLQANQDPCVVPIWDWIECNSDPTPRVIALDLNNRLLYGQLIYDFSSMDALQRIDFSQNFIFGDIPSFFGTLLDLQELNLASNYFSGVVPDSIACNKNLNLTLSGNSYLTSVTCSKSNKSPSSAANGNSGSSNGLGFQVPASSRRSKKKSNLPAILGGTISAFVVFWAAIGGYAMRRHRAKTAAAVAQESTPKQGPTEELPMNARPTEMSPSS